MLKIRAAVDFAAILVIFVHIGKGRNTRDDAAFRDGIARFIVAVNAFSLAEFGIVFARSDIAQLHVVFAAVEVIAVAICHIGRTRKYSFYFTRGFVRLALTFFGVIRTQRIFATVCIITVAVGKIGYTFKRDVFCPVIIDGHRVGSRIKPAQLKFASVIVIVSKMRVIVHTLKRNACFRPCTRKGVVVGKIVFAAVKVIAIAIAPSILTDNGFVFA